MGWGLYAGLCPVLAPSSVLQTHWLFPQLTWKLLEMQSWGGSSHLLSQNLHFHRCLGDTCMQ